MRGSNMAGEFQNNSHNLQEKKKNKENWQKMK